MHTKSTAKRRQQQQGQARVRRARLQLVRAARRRYRVSFQDMRVIFNLDIGKAIHDFI